MVVNLNDPAAHPHLRPLNCAAHIPICPGDTPAGQVTKTSVVLGAGAGAGAGADAGAGAGAGGFIASSALLCKLLTERRPRIKNIVSPLPTLHGHRQNILKMTWGKCRKVFQCISGLAYFTDINHAIRQFYKTEEEIVQVFYPIELICFELSVCGCPA